jgi:hypothetical protein
LELDTAKGQSKKVFNILVGKDKENGEVSSISHGYASTVYKSQGDSIDRVYVFHDHRATAPSNYVALSRHIQNVRLFITREETNSFEHLAEQLKGGYDKTAAHSFLLDDKERAKLDTPKVVAPSLAPEQKLDRPALRSEPNRPAPSLAPEGITPEPTPEVEQKETSYRNILRELFGTGEKIEKGPGQVERGDLRDDTDATKPGLFIKREHEGRSLDR